MLAIELYLGSQQQKSAAGIASRIGKATRPVANVVRRGAQKAMEYGKGMVDADNAARQVAAIGRSAGTPISEAARAGGSNLKRYAGKALERGAKAVRDNPRKAVGAAAGAAGAGAYAAGKGKKKKDTKEASLHYRQQAAQLRASAQEKRAAVQEYMDKEAAGLLGRALGGAANLANKSKVLTRVGNKVNKGIHGVGNLMRGAGGKLTGKAMSGDGGRIANKMLDAGMGLGEYGKKLVKETVPMLHQNAGAVGGAALGAGALGAGGLYGAHRLASGGE